MSIVKYSPSMGKDYSNDRKIWGGGHRSLVVGHDECTATVGVILKSVLF